MNPQQMYEACTDALGAFVRSAGFTDVVIGLSGGMDSTLVAVMAHDALGADHVHGVMLPGPYSSESSIDDAEALAANLSISNITVPICEPFEAFEAVLARACGGALIGLAAENTQARCRMVCLMALSNAHGWLMLNTGNKSEAAMGYSTLYGDTAGAFAPLGGVYKTDVFAMARWRNRRAVEEGACGPIPVNVFVKPPSAELAPDQEDEKSLGVDYATLDQILIAYVEEGRDAAAIVADTVMFKSPTSTAVDRRMADRMARIANISLDELGKTIFSASISDDKPADTLLFTDFKDFHIADHDFGVSQITCVDSERMMQRKDEFLAVMQKTMAERGYTLMILMLTDVLLEGTHLLYLGDEDIITQAFGVQLKDHTCFLPGVVSRKKQVIPMLTALWG